MLLSPQIYAPRRVIAAAAAATTTTFDPAHTDASLTLSNGNLTATNNSGGHSITRSVASYSSGKKYCEFVISVFATNEQIGICSTSFAGAQALYAFGGASMQANGTIGINSAAVGTGDTFTVGDVVSVAVDIGNGRIWFRVNAGSWKGTAAGDPVANTNGADITPSISGALCAAVDVFDLSTAVTVNFGATAYAQTVPSGYGNF